jgi:hypothetical protein
LLGIVAKSAQAAVVMICHTLLGGVSVTSMWIIQRLVEYVGGGKNMLVYDRWPLEYLFQTTDIAIILVVGFYGSLETVHVLQDKHKL